MADKNNIGIADTLLIEALEIATAQKVRKANTFKPGSAARQEIEGEAASLNMALNTLKISTPRK